MNSHTSEICSTTELSVMEVTGEEIDEPEKKTYRLNSLTPERGSHYWQHFHVWFFRRNENRHKIKVFVNYCVLPLAMIALFSGAILVRPKDQKSVAQNTTTKRHDFGSAKARETKTASKCVYNNPELNCTGIDFTTGPDELLEELKNNFQKEGLNLRLTNAKFANGGIERGWLPVEENVHPTITGLTLEGPRLLSIGAESFSNLPKLESFTLVGSGVTYLTRSAFMGLRNVWEFNLRDNAYLAAVEGGLLQEFSNLKTFQLQNMVLTEEKTSVAFFQNLTGSTFLASVLTVDLRFNSIGKFRKAFIEKFIKATLLYLSDSNIHDFETNAFQSHTLANTATIIDLSRNSIETFPEETFGKILLNNDITLNVEDNPVRCDCSMNWLQNYQITYNKTGEFGNLKCMSPSEYFGQSLFDVDLCSVANTTSTTSSSSSTTESPAEQVCKKSGNLKMTAPVASKYKVEEVLKNGNLVLEITTDETPSVVAFSDGSSNEMRCQTVDLQSSKVSVDNISHDTNYLFCFYSDKTAETGFLSFHDCLAYKTTLSAENQPWLTHREKVLTIIYIVCGLIGTLLLGGLLAFWLVRRVPTLLRGSERVEIVKSRNGETVLIMPERRERPVTPNGVYETISGYVSNSTQGFYDRRNPPPLPPYPPGLRRGIQEHEYLEPRYLRKLPKNADMLMEYEWYTSRNHRPKSNKTTPNPSIGSYA